MPLSPEATLNKSYKILFVFFICFFSCGVLADDLNSQSDGIIESDDGRIEISATVSKIKWDEEIIRSWDASDGVEIMYSRGGRAFICKADRALFTREGIEDSFKDKIQINGNITSNLDGINLISSELTLENIGESYRVEAGKDTSISGDDYSIETGHLLFDASDGKGQFPDGATFKFSIKNEEGKNILPFEYSEGNFFGQCLKIDTSGGVIETSQLDIQYSLDANDNFTLTRVILPSGAELHPLNKAFEDSEMLLSFGKAEIDFEKLNLSAHEKVVISNGPCKISCNDFSINWDSRNMILQGDVALERESVKFQTGILELNWDDEGRISLVAKENPKMIINVPEGKAEEILKGSTK